MNEILKEIVVLLCEMKWDFEIINLSGITKDNRIISAINPEDIGKDLLVIYTFEGGQEWVITEKENERLADLYKMLKETHKKGYSDVKIRDSEWVKKKQIKRAFLPLIDLIRNQTKNQTGYEDLKKDIEKILRKRGIVRLYDYVTEVQGSKDWEHSTFKLRYHDKIIFVLHNNSEVEVDYMNLIIENEFTSNIEKFFVINRTEKEEEIIIEIY